MHNKSSTYMHDERYLVFPSYTDSECMYHNQSFTSELTTKVPNELLGQPTESAKTALAGGSENGGGCGPPPQGAYRDYESRWTSHTSGSLALPCPRPLVTTSNQESQLSSFEYIGLSKYAVGGFIFIP